ncbi:hypothetical protein RUM44_010622 [Polyplax serrata]|uniref:Uncharacterized protein n=1 Tax=Polyplax serrata TaxID=468196 RepID=A0ABR1AMQ6_POLSC
MPETRASRVRKLKKKVDILLTGVEKEPDDRQWKYPWSTRRRQEKSVIYLLIYSPERFLTDVRDPVADQPKRLNLKRSETLILEYFQSGGDDIEKKDHLVRKIWKFDEWNSDAGDILKALVGHFRIGFAGAHGVEAAWTDRLFNSESDLK